MSKKVTYPCVGIYVRYTNGGYWATNEPFKTARQRDHIKQRLIAWKAKNAQLIKSLTLYEKMSENSQTIFYQDPRDFRLWLKYNFRYSGEATNPDQGTTTVTMPAHSPANDSKVMEQLVQKAYVAIQNGQLWQARIYSPSNQLVFDWTNFDGVRQGAEWMDYIDLKAQIND